MTKIASDFYSKEERHFKYRFGQLIASSLSGFLAGIIITLIIIFAMCDIVLKS